jgi:hypothetical protein
MPFIMQHMLSIPPAIILHMFCSVAAAISSSQVQATFMPPLHFSIFMVQRGIMAIPMLGIMPGIPDICPIIEGIPPDIPMPPIIIPRSIIIALAIATRLPVQGDVRAGAAESRRLTDTDDRPLDYSRPSGWSSQHADQLVNVSRDSGRQLHNRR